MITLLRKLSQGDIKGLLCQDVNSVTDLHTQARIPSSVPDPSEIHTMRSVSAWSEEDQMLALYRECEFTKESKVACHFFKA